MSTFDPDFDPDNVWERHGFVLATDYYKLLRLYRRMESTREVPLSDPKPKDPKELLGNVMHLWIDSYIVKNPTSQAPASISDKVFDDIEEWLIANNIEVDYCGWRESHRGKP